MFSKVQTPYVKYLPEFFIVSLSTKIGAEIEYFPKKVLNFNVFSQDNKSFVPFEYNPCTGSIIERHLMRVTCFSDILLLHKRRSG